MSARSQLSETLAFTITTDIGGTRATLVGTNASDSVAGAQLANFSNLSVTAFDADDVVITGRALTSASTISMGQGDDQVTLGAALTGAGSLVDLGEGADTFAAGNNNITGSSIKGFGGLDTYTFGTGTITSSFINGNAAGDRFTFSGTTLTSSSIAGGSEDDIITFANAGNNTLTGGRVNGQNGDDTISVLNIFAGTTTTMFGGQGNDTLTTAGYGPAVGTSHVIFSGDLGNDTLVGLAQAVDVSGDLLFGGDGNDSITTNGGADSMSGGAGVDTFIIAANENLNTASVTNVAGGTAGFIEAGDVFNLNLTAGAGQFNNVTANITDFVGGGAGDILNIGNANAAAVSGIGAVVTQAATGNVGLTGVTYKLAGSYNSANSAFTVTADNQGTDTLILLNGTSVNQYLLLKGTSASTLTSANFI